MYPFAQLAGNGAQRICQSEFMRLLAGHLCMIFSPNHFDEHCLYYQCRNQKYRMPRDIQSFDPYLFFKTSRREPN